MQRQLSLPDKRFGATVTVEPRERLTDEEYFAFCAANPGFDIERSAGGDITIMAPAGAESSFRSGEVYRQLANWARQEGSGKAFDSSVEFLLSTGAALSPDASWVRNEKLAQLSAEQLRKFPPIAPDFVAEVLSPSDRLPAAQAKMQEWLRAGVALGWLIDADRRTVWVYAAGRPMEMGAGCSEIGGAEVLPGFSLRLEEIWAGLRG